MHPVGNDTICVTDFECSCVTNANLSLHVKGHH